jgi:hypothetical protein
MMKAVAGTEVILTVGIIIAVGVALVQLRGVFSSQQLLAQEEVVVTFARDLESYMDKAIATTGDAAFVYFPTIKKYSLNISNNAVSISDKISSKTAGFSKSAPEIVENYFEDCEKIFVNKMKEKIVINCRCLEINETCKKSLLCCSGYCNETSKKCEEMPVCPAERICPGASESKKDSLGKDCCPTDVPFCTGGHCCPTNKPKWCDKPKTGSPRCVNQTEYETEGCEEICSPTISQCYNHWHWNRYDGTFFMNVQGYVCDYYEVCHPDIKPIIEEIINCCKNNCAGNCHSMCNRALSESGLSSTDTQDTRKKCYGLYAIYGLDGAAKWMRGYQTHTEEPASIMLRGQTWMCTGYSIALTTLLRSVGYGGTEVYSLCSPGHAFNLVKFPGEANYRFVDTVGNILYVSGITSSDPYRQNYGYCRTSYQCGCQNDGGTVNCPSPSNIILGASC